MKRTLILIMSLLSINMLSAQSTNNVWAFGWGCGVDFNTTPPTAISTRTYAYEGCASVSDSSGHLLMYAHGDTIFNHMHQPMPNGGNVLGTSATISSCSQGSLIVPKPGSNHEYYVFALQGITDALPAGRLFYNLVDMSLDGGLGDVVPGQKLIQLDMHLGEKMTAIAGTCNNIWVIVVPQSNTEFRAYEITSAGINHTPVISPFTAPAAAFDIGEIKGAHNGSKLIAALYSDAKFQLFDFDPALGTVSNPISFTNGPIESPYSACFSPDDTKLYLLFDRIYQYDLSLPTVAAIMGSKVGVTPALIDSTSFATDMQIAADGKLYIAKFNGSSLACINNPNAAGVACGFVPNAITLIPGTVSGVGLPNTVVNAVMTGKPEVKLHDTTMCQPWTASSSSRSGPYLWSTGDTSAAINIDTPGVYWVSSASGCGIVDSFIVGLPLEKSYLDDINVCYGDSVWVTVQVDAPPAADILWSTGGTGNRVTLADTGIYWVRIEDGACIATDTMSVVFEGCGCDFLFPNAFSPNGDGLNDYFLPKFSLERCNGLESYSMQIFNRWGEMVYSGNQLHKGWDGTFRGQRADVGVYMFIIYYRDRLGNDFSKKGDLTLLR